MEAERVSPATPEKTTMTPKTPKTSRIVRHDRWSGRGGFPSCEVRWAIKDADGDLLLSKSGNVRSWGTRAAASAAARKMEREA